MNNISISEQKIFNIDEFCNSQLIDLNYSKNNLIENLCSFEIEDYSIQNYYYCSCNNLICQYCANNCHKEHINKNKIFGNFQCSCFINKHQKFANYPKEDNCFFEFLKKENGENLIFRYYEIENNIYCELCKLNNCIDSNNINSTLKLLEKNERCSCKKHSNPTNDSNFSFELNNLILKSTDFSKILNFKHFQNIKKFQDDIISNILKYLYKFFDSKNFNEFYDFNLLKSLQFVIKLINNYNSKTFIFENIFTKDKIINAGIKISRYYDIDEIFKFFSFSTNPNLSESLLYYEIRFSLFELLYYVYIDSYIKNNKVVMESVNLLNMSLLQRLVNLYDQYNNLLKKDTYLNHEFTFNFIFTINNEIKIFINILNSYAIIFTNILKYNLINDKKRIEKSINIYLDNMFHLLQFFSRDKLKDIENLDFINLSLLVSLIDSLFVIAIFINDIKFYFNLNEFEYNGFNYIHESSYTNNLYSRLFCFIIFLYQSHCKKKDIDIKLNNLFNYFVKNINQMLLDNSHNYLRSIDILNFDYNSSIENIFSIMDNSKENIFKKNFSDFKFLDIREKYIFSNKLKVYNNELNIELIENYKEFHKLINLFENENENDFNFNNFNIFNDLNILLNKNLNDSQLIIEHSKFFQILNNINKKINIFFINLSENSIHINDVLISYFEILLKIIESNYNLSINILTCFNDDFFSIFIYYLNNIKDIYNEKKNLPFLFLMKLLKNFRNANNIIKYNSLNNYFYFMDFFEFVMKNSNIIVDDFVLGNLLKVFSKIIKDSDYFNDEINHYLFDFKLFLCKYIKFDDLFNFYQNEINRNYIFKLKEYINFELTCIKKSYLLKSENLIIFYNLDELYNKFTIINKNLYKDDYELVDFFKIIGEYIFVFKSTIKNDLNYYQELYERYKDIDFHILLENCIWESKLFLIYFNDNECSKVFFDYFENIFIQTYYLINVSIIIKKSLSTEIHVNLFKLLILFNKIIQKLYYNNNFIENLKIQKTIFCFTKNYDESEVLLNINNLLLESLKFSNSNLNYFEFDKTIEIFKIFFAIMYSKNIFNYEIVNYFMNRYQNYDSYTENNHNSDYEFLFLKIRSYYEKLNKKIFLNKLYKEFHNFKKSINHQQKQDLSIISSFLISEKNDQNSDSLINFLIDNIDSNQTKYLQIDISSLRILFNFHINFYENNTPLLKTILKFDFLFDFIKNNNFIIFEINNSLFPNSYSNHINSNLDCSIYIINILNIVFKFSTDNPRNYINQTFLNLNLIGNFIIFEDKENYFPKNCLFQSYLDINKLLSKKTDHFIFIMSCENNIIFKELLFDNKFDNQFINFIEIFKSILGNDGFFNKKYNNFILNSMRLLNSIIFDKSIKLKIKNIFSIKFCLSYSEIYLKFVYTKYSQKKDYDDKNFYELSREIFYLDPYKLLKIFKENESLIKNDIYFILSFKFYLFLKELYNEENKENIMFLSKDKYPEIIEFIQKEINFLNNQDINDLKIQKYESSENILRDFIKKNKYLCNFPNFLYFSSNYKNESIVIYYNNFIFSKIEILDIFYKEILLEVEFIMNNNSIKNIYFIKEYNNNYFNEDKVYHFFDEVADFTNKSTKLTSLINYIFILIQGNEYYKKNINNNMILKFTSKILTPYNINLITLLISLIILLIMFFSINSSNIYDEKIYSNNDLKIFDYILIIQAFSIIQIIINTMGFINYLFVIFPINLLLTHNEIKINRNSINYYFDLILLFVKNMFFTDEIKYINFNLIISIISNIHYKFQFLLVFQLLTISRFIKTLRNILKAFYLRSNQICFMILFLFIITYFYSSIGFYFLNIEFRDINTSLSVRSNDNKGLFFIDNFILHLDPSERSDGISDYLPKIKFLEENNRYYIRFFYDIIFYIIIKLLILNMINGIVVSTFTEMRDKDEKIFDSYYNYCYICTINKNEFEKRDINFFDHSLKIHYIPNYFLYFLYLNDKKNKLNYIERYLVENLLKKNVKIFPIGRTKILDDYNILEIDEE